MEPVASYDKLSEICAGPAQRGLDTGKLRNVTESQVFKFGLPEYNYVDLESNTLQIEYSMPKPKGKNFRKGEIKVKVLWGRFVNANDDNKNALCDDDTADTRHDLMQFESFLDFYDWAFYESNGQCLCYLACFGSSDYHSN